MSSNMFVDTSPKQHEILCILQTTFVKAAEVMILFIMTTIQLYTMKFAHTHLCGNCRLCHILDKCLVLRVCGWFPIGPADNYVVTFPASFCMCGIMGYGRKRSIYERVKEHVFVFNHQCCGGGKRLCVVGVFREAYNGRESNDGFVQSVFHRLWLSVVPRSIQRVWITSTETEDNGVRLWQSTKE